MKYKISEESNLNISGPAAAPETPNNQIRTRKASVSRLFQSANRYFSRQSSSSVSPHRTTKSSPNTPTTPTSLVTSSSSPTSPSSRSSRQAGCGGLGRRVSSCEDQTQPYLTADSSGEGDNHQEGPETWGEVRTEMRTELRNKKVSLMIEDFERRAADCSQEAGLTPSSTTVTTGSSSSRTSEVSSQSTESLEEEKTTGSSSTSSADSLTAAQKRERKLHLCAREIMTTERTFVECLTLVNTEFRNFVENRIRDTGKDIIPLEDFRKIFKHLPQLLAFNQDLLNDFEDRVENWDSNKKIADVIVKKGPFLRLYTHYIKDFESLCHHLDQCCKKYPQFKAVVSEYEALPQCHSLRLTHFLLKPVQRLPQYKMMLEEYMKHLEPDSLDFDDTTQALTIVASAAEHANTTVKKGVTIKY